jgi:hydroxymethylglutaryl-CoA reductase
LKPEKIIEGFSAMTREQKIQIASAFTSQPSEFTRQMHTNWKPELADFTENAISGFQLPYSLAPNFLINGKEYIVPMVTEESSVVAAASSAAKFWYKKGGFTTRIAELTKAGHIHFIWRGETELLFRVFEEIKPAMIGCVSSFTASMRARGGGIQQVSLHDMTDRLPGYFRAEVLFNTADAMGANFINTCLEKMSEFLVNRFEEQYSGGHIEVIMSILSNYTPRCRVECKLSCNAAEFDSEFLRRFELAVNIASIDMNRAVTHNKGIYNGVDAVILATGNDFRAAEAAGHSWAASGGRYTSLSRLTIQSGLFEFVIDIPLALGVTGGLTSLHPMAKASLALLGNPGADELMSVAASAGMANHFSALKALITGGIQRGHMKLHLANILNQLNAGISEKKEAFAWFQNKTVSYSAVKEFLLELRKSIK